MRPRVRGEALSVVSALVIRDIGTQGRGLRCPGAANGRRAERRGFGRGDVVGAGVVRGARDEKKAARARGGARAIAVVTHPFVFAKSASDLAREADVPDSDRAVTDEGNDDGAAVLEATRRFLRRAGVAEGGDARGASSRRAPKTAPRVASPPPRAPPRELLARQSC